MASPVTVVQTTEDSSSESRTKPKLCIQILTIVALVLTLVSKVLLWSGAHFSTLTSVGAAIGFFFFALFMLAAVILLTISPFKRQTTYGITISGIVFAAINTIVCTITAMILLLVISDYTPDCEEPKAGDTRYFISHTYEECVGYKVATSAMCFLTLSQVLYIVVGSLEVKRVSKGNQSTVIYMMPGNAPQPMMMAQPMVMTQPVMVQQPVVQAQQPGLPPTYAQSTGSVHVS